MAEIERPSADVLILHLSPYHSLDLVRIPSARKYRIVFAARWGVQQRAFVEVSYEQAREVAMFLGASDETIAAIGDPSPPLSNEEPLSLPPIPPRTTTRGI
ncbi:MAG: hypothetical protein Q6370_014325 [Candidatus Sigynarchaeota archaeon]|jgi:hypothetical protein